MNDLVKRALAYSMECSEPMLLQELAAALEASGRENERFRNGFDNLLKALDEAPRLPMELLSKDDLEKWTDTITGILKALGPYQATGKPITMWEAITEQGKR